MVFHKLKSRSPSQNSKKLKKVLFYFKTWFLEVFWTQMFDLPSRNCGSPSKTIRFTRDTRSLLVQNGVIPHFSVSDILRKFAFLHFFMKKQLICFEQISFAKSKIVKVFLNLSNFSLGSLILGS